MNSNPAPVRLFLRKASTLAVWLGIVLTLVFASRSGAQSSPLDTYPALMDTLLGGYYAAGGQMCDSLAARFGNHPGVLYARASVLYAHMLDLEDSVGRAEFIYLTEQCAEHCRELQSIRAAESAEIAFLQGSAEASRGMLLSHEGKLLPALKLIVSAKGAFDRAIEADPGFYDAYLGRGAYRYGVAKHASLVSWLPFIPSAESGWRDLLAGRRKVPLFPLLCTDRPGLVRAR